MDRVGILSLSKSSWLSIIVFRSGLPCENRQYTGLNSHTGRMFKHDIFCLIMTKRYIFFMSSKKNIVHFLELQR